MVHSSRRLLGNADGGAECAVQVRVNPVPGDLFSEVRTYAQAVKAASLVNFPSSLLCSLYAGFPSIPSSQTGRGVIEFSTLACLLFFLG